MRPTPLLFIAIALLSLTGCAQQTAIANHDSAALVQAIRAANQTPGKDVIRLAHRGLYVIGGPAEPGLLLPAISGDLQIIGDGAEIRGYTGDKLALLQIDKGSTLALDNLSLAEGSEGAVRNFGALKMTAVRIIDSTGSRSSAIVLNHGDIDAIDSEIAYNTLAGAHRDAGTVLNFGRIVLDRTTIHDNRAIGGSPNLAVAGGVLNYGSLRVDGLVMQDNDAEQGAAALQADGILNLGNGEVEGATARGAIRNGGGLAILNP